MHSMHHSTTYCFRTHAQACVSPQADLSWLHVKVRPEVIKLPIHVNEPPGRLHAHLPHLASHLMTDTPTACWHTTSALSRSSRISRTNRSVLSLYSAIFCRQLSIAIPLAFISTSDLVNVDVTVDVAAIINDIKIFNV